MCQKQKTTITNIYEATKALCRDTEKLIDAEANGDPINHQVEREKTRKFDSMARLASRQLQYRKDTGSTEKIPFLEKA